jgi:superfamily II DNA or RNA helicase
VVTDAKPNFGKIGFKGKLRPSQIDSSNIVSDKLNKNEKNILIVAPPGSGKTVLGLYIWSDLVRLPALVLSPNSAIQAQWIARTKELFELDGRNMNIGTSPDNNNLLTSLTYQSLTLPKRNDDNLDDAALLIWIEKLISDGEASNIEIAKAWLSDLKEHNLDYYKQRLGTYRKRVRDDYASKGNALWLLHDSAKKKLETLRASGIGLIILDECHHLLGHWGRILSDIREYFANPIILGLTATPPELNRINPSEKKRYQDFFGEIDYEVPIPALVRNSNLSPYQDLVYFVRPTTDELEYISNVDKDFNNLIDEIRKKPDYNSEGRCQGLDSWLYDILSNLKLPGGRARNWNSFVKRDESLANLSRLYLVQKGLTLPHTVPPLERKLLDANLTSYSILLPLLDRYIRYGLIRSKSKLDHDLADDAKKKLRMLGMQITETGMQPCASPIGRVMAYANAKYDALIHILSSERDTLGIDIRAVIITDFEKTSATKLVDNILDEGAGGAVAAFRALLQNKYTDTLDPVLMTGSTVLVDDDLSQIIMPKFNEWVKNRNLDISFTKSEKEGYYEISGQGSQWTPRYYTEMITNLFQEGVTKCLVGTRGLLGEGWDASKINVLIDLTTVTTNMSINQLRGRSFRLDKDNPKKVANNWDIVCLAEEFTKGFDDYYRFKKKHSKLYGVCDDGAIEKGVGHVHASFTEVRPEGISGIMSIFNDEMILRSKDRQKIRELWAIGQPFDAQAKNAFELKMTNHFAQGFPPSLKIGRAEWTDENLIISLAESLVRSFKEIGLIRYNATVSSGERGGGWIRTFLEYSDDNESKLFIDAMEEILSPLDKPRYIIPREIKIISDTWISKILPEVVGKYFQKSSNKITMYHSIPKSLCQNKKDALIFQKNWNWFVSPGEIIYAHNDVGIEKVRYATENNLYPLGSLHAKEVFI